MKQVRNLGSIINDELRLEFIKKTFLWMDKKQTLLDLGCGKKPFREIYEKYVDYSIGIDVPTSPHDKSLVDIQAIGTEIPFKNATFDVVICTEVMEHVAEPKQLLSEIRRVLRPDGILILTTPFLVPVHEAPYDFYRYTVHGLEYLVKQSGLNLIKIIPFSELFGVLISFLAQAQLKFWNILSKKLRLSVIYSRLNPFILLPVYLPQIVYLYFLKNSLLGPLIKRGLKKLDYTAKGYGLIAKK